MNPELTVLPGDTPDDFDLELLELQAVDTSQDRARIEAARSGPLAEADRELAEARDFFAQHAPSLRPRSREPSPWSRAAWRLAPVAALAAAAVLVFLASPQPSPEGVRAMGGIAVELDVQRDGMPAGGGFEAHDELLMTLQSPRDGFLDVWTRQADGTVSELVVAQPVSQGERVAMPGAVRLDPYAGEEWLLMRVTDTPTSPGGLQGVDRDDLEAGASYALEVTRQ